MNTKLNITLFLILTHSSVITMHDETSNYYHYNEPQDPNKTPTTPDIIDHYSGLIGARNFYRKRIFFDKDEFGNPYYKTIAQHAKDNPKFGQVKLVIFYETAWYKLRFSDQFKIVGVFANVYARQKIINSATTSLWELITAGINRGAVWCPAQNAIIGGTRDPKICDRFAQYLKKQK